MVQRYAPTPNDTALPMAKAMSDVVSSTVTARNARRRAGSSARWWSASPSMTCASAPLERMSSVPARRSPMKPYICAETSRTCFHHFTATFRSGPAMATIARTARSEEHTSELQSPCNLVCRLLLEKKKKKKKKQKTKKKKKKKNH